MNTRSTIVIKLPEVVGAKQVRSFMRQLKPVLKLDQPCVAVDLSRVQQIDTCGLDMLLECLLQVVNRDGAFRLAGISPEAATILELTRMDRVFNMFPKVSEDIGTFVEDVPQFEQMPGEGVVQPAAA